MQAMSRRCWHLLDADAAAAPNCQTELVGPTFDDTMVTAPTLTSVNDFPAILFA